MLEHELLRLPVPAETLAESRDQMHAKCEPIRSGDVIGQRVKTGRSAVDLAAGQSAQQERPRGELLRFALRIEEIYLSCEKVYLVAQLKKNKNYVLQRVFTKPVQKVYMNRNLTQPKAMRVQVGLIVFRFKIYATR